MLYSEPFRSRLDAALAELNRLGSPIPEVLKLWRKDAAGILDQPIKKDEACDWLIGTDRYQAGYADRNLAAMLLCDSLWRILEAEGQIPETCKEWWSDHLFKDRTEPTRTRPEKALLPADILERYARERQLFHSHWIEAES